MIGGFIIDKLWNDDMKTLIKRNFRCEMIILVGVGLLTNIFFLMNGFETDTLKYITCYTRSSLPKDLVSYLTKQCWIGGEMYIDQKILPDLSTNLRAVESTVNVSRSAYYDKINVAKIYPYTILIFMFGNFIFTVMFKLPKILRNCMLREDSIGRMKKEDILMSFKKISDSKSTMQSIINNQNIVSKLDSNSTKFIKNFIDDFEDIERFNTYYVLIIRFLYMICIGFYFSLIFLVFTQFFSLLSFREAFPTKIKCDARVPSKIDSLMTKDLKRKQHELLECTLVMNRFYKYYIITIGLFLIAFFFALLVSIVVGILKQKDNQYEAVLGMNLEIKEFENHSDIILQLKGMKKNISDIKDKVKKLDEMIEKKTEAT